MAYKFSLNNNPATGAIAMFELWQCLSSAGWTKVADSDGTTYSSSGTQVTGGGTGAGGLNNTKAWMRLQDPVAVREIVIQRVTNSTNYAIWYNSGGSKFTGGSPAATQVPTTATSSDAQFVCGSGTPASPTGATLFTTDGTYRWHVICSNASLYGFVAIGYVTGTDITATMIAMDPMQSGTYPTSGSADADPVVWICPAGPNSGNVGTTIYMTSETANQGPLANLKYGLTGAGWVQMSALSYQSAAGQAIPADIGSNPFTGNAEGYPIAYARRSALTAPVGWKGFSSLLLWAGTSTSTGNTAAGKTYIFFGNLLIPWDGSTVPQV